MPIAYGYARVSHEDSSQSGLGVEASLHTLSAWWKYQQEVGTGFTWGLAGWRGERVEPKVKGTVRPRSLISKYDRGQETSDGIFVDEAVSAYKVRLLQRPAGARLAARLQPGDMVVFPRLDRAFRGVSDFSVTIERWMKAGILIQFLMPNVDLTTAHGMAFAQVAAVFAQWESATKSERMKEAQSRGRERGQKMGRFVSIGMKQSGWTTRIAGGVSKRVPVLVPDEEARRDIQDIIRLKEQGHSCAAIADSLELARAVSEGRDSPWPRAPYRGSENRRWDAGRVWRAYKARKRIPLANIIGGNAPAVVN